MEWSPWEIELLRVGNGCRWRPDHVFDAQGLGNQLELVEAVGDFLLGGDHFRREEQRAVALAFHRGQGDVCRQAEQWRNLFGDVFGIGLGPFTDSAHFLDKGLDHLGIFLRVVFGRQVELMVVDDALAIAQGARLQLLFGGSLVRIPDHPGIDAAALERSAGIGGRQEYGLDVGVFEAGVLQRPDQQVVNIGAFVQDDFLALEVRYGFDCRVLRHQDRFAVRRWRFVGDVEQIGAGRLGEYRRRFTGDTEVDGADVQAFQQLRAAGNSLHCTSTPWAARRFSNVPLALSSTRVPYF